MPPTASRFVSVLDPDDYGPSQSLGRRLRAAQSWGIRYPSVRHAGGECVGIFRPRALRHAKAAAHLALHWDGTRITHWYEKRSAARRQRLTAKAWRQSLSRCAACGR